MMDWNILAFLVFPYISLTVFVVGHLVRYLTDPYRWNSKSSQLLEGKSLKLGSYLFHYGIILTFVGHFAGLLIPQAVYDMVGIDGLAHTRIAIILGLLFGSVALLGNVLLLWRRITIRRVLETSDVSDLMTSILLLLVISIGTYNVLFGHYYVLDTIAPWIRSIVLFAPDPRLMADAPFAYQLHVLSAFALFAFSPFSRLIHIWSIPLPYFLRSPILLRRRSAES
jgi:nitrate reductase gamma subunit